MTQTETEQETPKGRTDRQLIELLNELRVALPGAQVLLGFLLTVPFTTRFGETTHGERVTLFVCLVCSACGIVLLMAPSVYHRLRWEHGGKQDVVRVAHRLFIAGTAFLALGLLAAVFLVTDVVFGPVPAAVTTALIACAVAATWYVLPLTRGQSDRLRHEE